MIYDAIYNEYFNEAFNKFGFTDDKKDSAGRNRAVFFY